MAKKPTISIDYNVPYQTAKTLMAHFGKSRGTIESKKWRTELGAKETPTKTWEYPTSGVVAYEARKAGLAAIAAPVDSTAQVSARDAVQKSADDFETRNEAVARVQSALGSVTKQAIMMLKLQAEEPRSVTNQAIAIMKEQAERALATKAKGKSES